MTAIRKVRFKTRTLEAVQFDGTRECAEALIGWMKTAAVLWSPGEGVRILWGGEHIAGGAWFVRHENGRFQPYSNEQFCQLFDELVSEEVRP